MQYHTWYNYMKKMESIPVNCEFRAQHYNKDANVTNNTSLQTHLLLTMSYVFIFTCDIWNGLR